MSVLITAVDTNILLDILLPDETYGEYSERNLAEALEQGSLVISELVFAEVSARFDSGTVSEFLLRTGIRLQPSSTQTLRLAGEAWALYATRRPDGFICPRCGVLQATQCNSCGLPARVRQHLIADFLIGAHALTQADCLMTRDRGYFSRYFPQLTLIQ